MLNKINNQPVQMEHSIITVREPHSITLRCDCGWWTRQSRHQNALGRESKLRKAVAEHERAIAPAKVISWMA